MSDEKIEKLKNNIIAIGSLLWEKELVSGLNGNISARINDREILLTSRGACLGLLQEKNILRMSLDGEVLEKGEVSTEKLLHSKIYENFKDISAVIHTHTTYTNAYFLNNDKLNPKIFESKFYLGEVSSVVQHTPSVLDAAPVVEELKNNNIVVLKNHGVVAMGKDHFDCFLLIQALEDAVKVDAISRLYVQGSAVNSQNSEKAAGPENTRRFKLFSQEQINGIVELVNQDELMKQLGGETKMTMDLAVKLDETGQVYSFHFQNGHIERVAHDENAEFLINAPESVWRSVFNQELDPFVATTQKKMSLKGDFGKISKWYAPCSRIFELWTEVPIE